VGKPIKAYAAQVIDRNTTVIFEDKKQYIKFNLKIINKASLMTYR